MCNVHPKELHHKMEPWSENQHPASTRGNQNHDKIEPQTQREPLDITAIYNANRSELQPLGIRTIKGKEGTIYREREGTMYNENSKELEP